MLPKLWMMSAVLLFARTRFKKDSLSLLGLSLILVAVISSLVSGFVPLNLIGKYNSYHGSVLTLILCWLAYNTANNRPKDHDKLVEHIVGAAAICGVICAYQFFDAPHFQQNHRSIGTIGNPAFCSAFLTLGFGLSSNWLAIPILVGILATKTRAAWVAIMAIFLYKKRAAIGSQNVIAILCGFSYLFLYLTFFRDQSDSDFGRVEAWRAGIKMCLMHHWFGVGSESFFIHFFKLRSPEFIHRFGLRTAHDYAHNDIIHVAASWGYPGLAIYLAMLVKAWKQSTERIKTALIGVFVCAKFNAVATITLFLIALLLGSQSKYSQIENRPQERIAFNVLNIRIFIFASKLYLADILYFQAQKTAPPQKNRMIWVASKLNPYQPIYETNFNTNSQ